MRQNLVAVFVAYQPFQLVVQRVALRVECPHHLGAVDRLCVLEFEGTLLFTGDYFVRHLDLILNFFVFLVGVCANAVLVEIHLMLILLD